MRWSARLAERSALRGAGGLRLAARGRAARPGPRRARARLARRTPQRGRRRDCAARRFRARRHRRRRPPARARRRGAPRRRRGRGISGRTPSSERYQWADPRPAGEQRLEDLVPALGRAEALPEGRDDAARQGGHRERMRPGRGGDEDAGEGALAPAGEHGAVAAREGKLCREPPGVRPLPAGPASPPNDGPVQGIVGEGVGQEAHRFALLTPGERSYRHFDLCGDHL